MQTGYPSPWVSRGDHWIRNLRETVGSACSSTKTGAGGLGEAKTESDWAALCPGHSLPFLQTAHS